MSDLSLDLEATIKVVNDVLDVVAQKSAPTSADDYDTVLNGLERMQGAICAMVTKSMLATIGGDSEGAFDTNRVLAIATIVQLTAINVLRREMANDGDARLVFETTRHTVLRDMRKGLEKARTLFTEEGHA